MSAAPELYLVVEAGPGAEAQLASALGSGLAASVLIRPGQDQRLDPSTSKRLVEIIQSQKAAALIADDANLARTLKADGVHLTWSKDQASRYKEAREILGARFIVGVDAGRSRHDAMSLAEAGADYIAFGIPPHVDDRETAAARQLDLVAWWAGIFEIPCVAFDAAEDGHRTELVRAGADFVALTVPANASPEAARKTVEDAGRALTANAVTA